MAPLNTTGRHFNWRNFVTSYFISYGVLAFGFPASIISTTLASPEFKAYFHLANAHGVANARENTLIGATNGVFQAGAFVNCFITCYCLSKLGRKNTFYYNSLVGILAGGLMCGSKTIGMFLAGRFFAGMSAWGFLIATPVFLAELAPPDLRGFYTGLVGVHIGLGYLLAACTGRGFATTAGNLNWRGPLGVYLVFPGIMILITLLSPESPRWLLINGKTEKARDIVFKMHTVKGNDEFAQAEFSEMEKQIAIDRTLDTSWLSMFTKPSYRKRTLICGFYCFCGQSTAVLVINNYGPTFYSSLGYGTLETIDFQVGWVSLAAPFCLLGALLLDRVGRRILLLIGIGGCCICLSLEAAASASFTAHPHNLGFSKFGVAALYMFNVCYNLGVDVGGNVFYAEVFPNHIRDKGVAITNAVLALADLVYLEVTPTAFANIGWKFFLVFICISAVGFVILFFILPETKGIPLEEMGKLFGDEHETNIYFLDNPLEITASGHEGKGIDQSAEEKHSGDIEKGDRAVHTE